MSVRVLQLIAINCNEAVFYANRPIFKTFALKYFIQFSKSANTRICWLKTRNNRTFVEIDQKKIVQHHVKGYEEFAKLVEDLETNGEQIHVLFIGGKEENGTSWCRYCVKAEPVIMEALPKASENSHFIHVEVGERSYWKDINCPFRKDPRTHLVILPTLLRWKSRQRLEGERCSNQGFVEMLFEDKD